MNNYILLLFEGEKTEKIIFKSLRNYYLNDNKNTILITVYCSDIYSLYHVMDRDHDLDLFSLIKEKEQNEATLNGITRDSVSEIFLFFDYDGHASAADDAKLEQLLKHFDEETENGKLYVSYPMVEALKHLKRDVPFQDIIVPAKNNIRYKQLVHRNHDACYSDIKILTHLHWSTIISEHCKKLSYLMTNVFQLPKKLVTQIEVFEMQKTKHITPDNNVAVLSAFPIFIADYYGYSKLPSLIL